ncbi:MAG: hypothetical protein ABL997_04780 [Planctomycetota bacterium]
MKPFLTLAVVTLFAACQNPAVWRTPVAPGAAPLPTLCAAASYDFQLIVQQQEIVVPEGAEIDFGGIWDSIADNPDLVIDAAAQLAREKKTFDLGRAAVAGNGAAMHAEILACLNDLGFSIETDSARSSKLGTASADAPAYVPEPCSAATFDTLPVWGPGSKTSIAETLRTERLGEAYASIRVEFQIAGNELGQPVGCSIRIVVVDRNANQLFGGNTAASVPWAGTFEATVSGALRAAMAPLAKPETVGE